MSELKSFIVLYDGKFIRAYEESEADKVIARQKYKRCLAMAKWCEARYDEEDAKVNGHYSSWDYVSEEMKYWERWRWRWEALAEEPTWAKFLQLIHKEAK